MQLLTKIRTILFGPGNPAPEREYYPPSQPAKFSIEIDEPDEEAQDPVQPVRHRRPDGDSWRYEGGQWVRPVKGISGPGMIDDDEEPQPRRRQVISRNDPFKGKRFDW